MARVKLEEGKVNPRIARDIKNLIKPYLKLINKSSDYYKLHSLAHDIERINIRVNKDVVKLLVLSKLAAQQKIEKKIQRLQYRELEYSKKELGQFLHRNKINSKIVDLICGFIYGTNLINLCWEDFKIITKNAKSAKLSFFNITNFDGKAIDSLLKPKLKGMKNAILIITGNKNTTLDELDSVWESTLRSLPKNAKTACAYKVDDVKNLQLNLLTVK